MTAGLVPVIPPVCDSKRILRHHRLPTSESRRREACSLWVESRPSMIRFPRRSGRERRPQFLVLSGNERGWRAAASFRKHVESLKTNGPRGGNGLPEKKSYR